MPRAYHRFHLTNLGEFLPFQDPQNGLSFLYLLVRLVIKPIPLSRYPLARKGILFGGPAMEKSLDTRRR